MTESEFSIHHRMESYNDQGLFWDKICNKQFFFVRMVARDILTQHQALVKQFAKILDFALEFDEFKMLKPGIQNDFFFYKRIMNKMTKSSRYNFLM